MGDKKSTIVWWVSLAVLGLGLFAIGTVQTDPDFGWHKRMGQLIVERGHLPAGDPFSYSMPSFPFVDHEWLTNVILFQLHEWFGKVGLAALFALLGVLTVVVAVPRRLWSWAVVPVLFSIDVLWGRGGVRPQVESWLFLAILLRLWSERGVWIRWRWIVPAGFVLWANLHGSFALGLVILGWVIFLTSLQNRKICIRDWIIWLLSVAGTLVNPYGWHLWYEVWMQITDTKLRTTIVEWQPFYSHFEITLLFIGVLVIAFGVRNLRAWPWWQTGILVLMGIAGLSSLRHAPLFVIVSLPVVAAGFDGFYREIVRIRDAVPRAKRFFGILIGISAVFAIVNVGLLGYGVVKVRRERIEYYPKDAIVFMKSQQNVQQVFSSYNWGGYLIEHYPEQQVFIDGRMPSWRWGLRSPLWYLGLEHGAPMNGLVPKGESRRALDDYFAIVEAGEKGLELLDSYAVSHVIWSVPAKVSDNQKKLEQWGRDFGKFLGLNLPDEEKKRFEDILKEHGWEEVYRDDVAVVLRRV